MHYNKFISNVVSNIKHSEIDRIFEMASRMDDVIVLAMGQPDFNMPIEAANAGIEAINNNHSKYTDDLGIEELREAISNYVLRKYGVGYDSNKEIIAVAGVGNGSDTALRAIINPGDEIIIHQPGYNSYIPCINMAAGVPVIIETSMKDGFKFTPEKLKSMITPKTKALLLNYPNNPTGATMNREELLAISKVVKEADILVLSDEVYSELVYDDEFTCFASLTDMKERTIVLNGVSKSHSMPGWRLGFACGPAELIDAMLKVHMFGVINAPSISQYAATAALSQQCDEYININHKIYDVRRRFMMKRFEEIGLDFYEPKGAMFIFPSIKETGLSSEEFCNRLLLEAKVAVVPGYEFGECGEGFFRCSYTTSIEKIAIAMNRIEEFVKSI